MSDMRNVPILSLYMHKKNPFPKLFRMLKTQIKQTKAGNLKKEEEENKGNTMNGIISNAYTNKNTHYINLKASKTSSQTKRLCFLKDKTLITLHQTSSCKK